MKNPWRSFHGPWILNTITVIHTLSLNSHIELTFLQNFLELLYGHTHMNDMSRSLDSLIIYFVSPVVYNLILDSKIVIVQFHTFLIKQVGLQFSALKLRCWWLLALYWYNWFFIWRQILLLNFFTFFYSDLNTWGCTLKISL